MANKYLSVVKGNPFPLDAVTQKTAWVGRSGSGKSYGAGKFAEELLEHHIQTVILDPVGIWYGLRMNADGKAKGYSMTSSGFINALSMLRVMELIEETPDKKIKASETLFS